MNDLSTSEDNTQEFSLINKLCATIQDLEQAIEQAVIHILKNNRRPPHTVDLRIQAFQCSIITLLGHAKKEQTIRSEASNIQDAVQVAMEKYDFYHLIASV